jgi:acyl-CoA reductase-like NAD-dependent aldehyde dehydrogenase
MSPATVAKTISSSPIIGHMLIGGKLVDSAEGGWIDCLNSANEDYIGKVPLATTADVDRAVETAEAAQGLIGRLRRSSFSQGRRDENPGR